MFFSFDRLVGPTHINTYSDFARLSRDDHNGTDPWCWSINLFDDKPFELFLDTISNVEWDSTVGLLFGGNIRINVQFNSFTS
jgi:hypothetical protein